LPFVKIFVTSLTLWEHNEMNRATKTNTGIQRVSKVPQSSRLCENPNAEKTKTESHTMHRLDALYEIRCIHLICTQ